jgi:hypothetical protein
MYLVQHGVLGNAGIHRGLAEGLTHLQEFKGKFIVWGCRSSQYEE